MAKTIETVQKKTNRSKVGIFLDMAQCMLRYGAGYYDYQIFAFYSLTAEQRGTYVTRLISKKLNEYLNDPAYAHIFNNKNEFNVLFRDYIGREYIDLEAASREEAVHYLKNRDFVFVKPKDRECGAGCERIKVSDYPSAEALYDSLLKKGICTVEDLILQHPALNALYPNAVNCMRIITIVDDMGKPHCVYAVQKMGYNGRFLDNNGLFSPVDLKSGKLLYPAHSGETAKGVLYEEHPDTHVHLQGYQLPYVQEAIALCLQASLVVPQIRYVGWDVAISKKGPVIVEGNDYCAHDFWQLPPHTPDKTGMLPKIREILPNFKP